MFLCSLKPVMFIAIYSFSKGSVLFDMTAHCQPNMFGQSLTFIKDATTRCKTFPLICSGGLDHGSTYTFKLDAIVTDAEGIPLLGESVSWCVSFIHSLNCSTSVYVRHRSQMAQVAGHRVRVPVFPVLLWYTKHPSVHLINHPLTKQSTRLPTHSLNQLLT